VNAVKNSVETLTCKRIETLLNPDFAVLKIVENHADPNGCNNLSSENLC
jgi:hypothetical protein